MVGTSIELLALSAAELRTGGIFLICLILAISVHEFAHAITAHKLGDPTPSRHGRVTLNPISHADPIGTVILPIVMILFPVGFFFGWGRPVPTEPRYYTRKITLRGGLALVSFAGPFSNLLLAALSLLLMWALTTAGLLQHIGPSNPLAMFFQLNLVLFAFNLIPLHPLDGGKVLAWLLPDRLRQVDDFLTRYGGIILLVLLIAFPRVLQLFIRPVLRLGSSALAAVL